uniref:Uncharacterized protein n=1 Tax=Stegastes partitus TaxID=144197 RepID=A0A3B5AZG8_9TELE
MGKPLSRPDCLRQNPRCLGKGDEDEAYIEDCYVPQRSIYDTMRINEQIDQGTKLCQPSRSTLGSGGEVRGEGSTLSSNGTIGADLGGVFVSRCADNAGGVKKLDERVIFDALKLTSDPQIMSPPRRHQGSDKKDNPNRRSWKAFMPPSYPEFAERLEASSADGAEKRSSGAGIPLSPLQPISSHLPPTTPTSSTPSLPPYTPSPLSSAPHTPPVTQIGLRHNLPVLPPLPPLLGEDNTDEESLYLLDPPSPFLKEEEGLVYGGLPLSPCLSQEGGDEGLLGWGAQGGELRERTASELKFEEDERRILEELEADEQQDECMNVIEEEEEAWKMERDKAEEERAQREEREWEAVLKLENREIIDQSWHRETLESEGWDLTGSTGHWPLLTPPTGFGGPGAHSASPCPSSGAESDDLFLELERQCEEDEGEEGVEMSVDPEPLDPYNLPCLEEEEEEREEEARTVWVDTEGTLPLDAVNQAEPGDAAPGLEKTTKHSEHIEEIKNLMKAQDHEKEHGFIDEESDIDCTVEDKTEVEEEEEEMSCPTDSALGQQLESDSSGIHMSQPDRTAVSIITPTECEQEKPAHTETDLDSGASSERDEEDYEASSPSRSPLNPYAEKEEEVEEEEEQDEGKLREEEELGTEWDVYDQSEPSLDSSEGVLMDQSQEPVNTAEKEVDNECTPDVDIQTPGQEDPVPSDFSKPTVEITCDTEGTSDSVVPTDMASGLDLPEQAPDVETSVEVTASTPKSDSLHIHPPPSLPHSPSKSDSCGAGLDSKDSEAFVISDSFVYLAVSAPPQYPSDCPPSPVEDFIPPSPIPKPPCSQDPHDEDEEEEEASFLSPDSFVYMAAPERPQPGPSDVGSACDDTQDLDSYSEGTQSGMDGVEFVLGSMTGDSDWESDGSALDFPPLMSTDQAWDQLEPGLLQNLFTQTEPPHTQTCGPLEDELQTGATASPTDLHLEPEPSSKAENETTSLPCFDTDTQSEVGLFDHFYHLLP